ncbi:MAG: hypothetical protein AB7H66_13165 [Hyphomonadaceae bacterium]
MLNRAIVHVITRGLCWLTLVSWIAILIGWLVLVSMLALQSASLLGSAFAQIFVALLGLHMLSVTTLYIWRSCERCGYHLYQFWNPSWVTGTLGRLNKAPRPVHGNAESVCGFYSLGGTWSKAAKGVCHCGWCGYPDAPNHPSVPE